MSKIIGAMFQNKETGVTQFVDQQQIEWGFENNNPRLDKCFDVYDQKELLTKLAEKDAEIERLRNFLFEGKIEMQENAGSGGECSFCMGEFFDDFEIEAKQ